MGKRMRVDLARALLENRDIIVFDEFTSVVEPGRCESLLSGGKQSRPKDG